MTEVNDDANFAKVCLRVSRAFYNSDPMHTGCQENACFDEYERIADHAAQLICAGHSNTEAIRQALEASFGDWVKEAHVAAVLEQLDRS